MARQVLSPSRRGWIFVAVAGLAWLSLGCSPQTLSIFLLPFVDNNKEPEYKLFAADKELTLAVMARFAGAQFQPEYVPADQELAEHVAAFLRKRSQENKHTLKIVPHAEVRALQAKYLDDGGSPLDLGRQLKADYVLDLAIDSFSLYQKGGLPKMYRGSTRISMNLYRVKAKDADDPLVFTKTHNAEFTGSRGVPMEVGNSNPADFRQMFMRRLGRDISRVFVAFPMDELKEWD